MSRELEPGVVSLGATVAHQPQAIVSRTLIKKASGTVTVFAFDAGEGLSEHTAAFEALVLGIEGEAEISISGTPHRLGPGELLRLPAREPHAVQARSAFKMLLIMLKD
ncbi:MAG TPA: cupin domain-containing protein [Candidatus Eisenbacteria bacterium]|nr:cupin domain-containing protein [Candidatus Eisenbacteria bacterium]